MGTKTTTPALSDDYRSFLQRRLSQAQSRIKSADILSGLAIITASALGFLLLAVMTDQLVELPVLVRSLALLVFLSTMAGLVTFWIVVPLFRSINVRFAARSVEQADPRMKNSVLNWVELNQSDGTLAEPVMTAIGARAASDLSKVRIEDAIQPRNVLPSLYVLAAIIVLFCAFSLVTTKSFGTSVKRVLFPWAGIDAPSATEVALTFEPGEDAGRRPASLPFDGKLEVIAHVTRGNPQKVVGYLRAEGSDYEEPVEFDRSAPDSYEFKLTRAKIQKTLALRVVADDFESSTYTISVSQPPVVVDWSIHYEPPAYTGQPPFDSNSPNIDALEGTAVEIRATTNVEVDPTSGLIELNTEGVESTQPMTLAEGSANELVGKLILKSDGTYRLSFRDVKGRMPEFRPSHDIRVRKDLPPVITFDRPVDKESQHPVNRPLQLAGSVRDDFGLYQTSLTLVDSAGDKLLTKETGGLKQDMLGSQWDFKETIDLTRTSVQPGDKLEYWVEAIDNKLPLGNSVQSRKLERRTIVVLPPEEAPKDPPKAKEKNDPNQKNDKQDDADSSPDEKQQGEPDDANDDKKKEGTPSESKDQNTSRDENAESSPGDNGESSDSSNDPGKEGVDRQVQEGDNSPQDKPPSEGKEGNEQSSNSASERNEENPSDASTSNDPSGENGESGSSDRRDQALSDEDRKALDKLEKHFNEKNDAERSEPEKREPGREAENPSTDSPPGSKNQASDDTEKNKQKEERTEGSQEKESKGTKEDSRDPSDASPGQESDAKKSENDPKGKNDPKSKDGSQGKGEPKADEQSQEADSKPTDPSADRKPDDAKSQPNESPDANRDGKSTDSKEPKDEVKDPSRDSQQAGDQAEAQEKQKADSKTPSNESEPRDKQKGSEQGSPGNDPNSEKESNETGQKESSSEKPAAQDGSKKNPGAGKQGESPDKARPDRAQPGEASSKDNGPESDRSKDNAPKPDSEGAQDQNPKGSHKEGPDNARSAPEGNQDGQASQGESSKSGQSSTGSPSKEKGDNSESTGERKGKGQTEGEGDRQEGDQSPGSKDRAGKPSSNGAGKESDAKPGNESGEKKSENTEDGAKDSSQSPTDNQAKGEPKANESKPGDDPPNPDESKDESGSSPGENSDRPGSDRSSTPSDDSKQDPGANEPSSEKPSSDQKGQPGNDSASKPSNGQGANGPTGNNDDNNQQGSQPSGGTRGNPEEGPESTFDDSGDQADPNDRRKGSNLVLKKLEEQIKNKKIDPELLKEMGWTEQDAQDFYRRLREQAAAEKTQAMKGKDRQSFGQGTDLQKSARTGAGKRTDAMQDLYSGQRTPPPPAIRKRFEAYTRGLSEEGKSPASTPPADATKPAPPSPK